MRDGSFCYWHDPEHEEQAAEARRLGGLRRRREKTLVGAYDLASLATLDGIWRILQIAVIDVLSLDNSIPRSRTLISAVQAAIRLRETGEVDERLAALEAALAMRTPQAPGTG